MQHASKGDDRLLCGAWLQVAPIGGKPLTVGDTSTQLLPLGLLVLQRHGGTLADLIPFELCQDSEHAEDHLARCAGRINLLREAYEVCTCLVQAFPQFQGFPRVPGQPGEAVDYQDAARVAHRVYGSLKTWPLVHAVPADTLVRKGLHQRVPHYPTPCSDLAALGVEGDPIFCLPGRTDSNVGNGLLVACWGLGFAGHGLGSYVFGVLPFNCNTVYPLLSGGARGNCS